MDHLTSQSDLADMVQFVGPEAYAAARTYVWSIAAGTGAPGSQLDYALLDPVFDLASEIWFGATLPLSDRLRLTFALYRDLPHYWLLTYSGGSSVLEMSPEERVYYFGEIRSLITDADERISDPALYFLWVELFEDPDTVEIAWRFLTGDGVSDLLLRRVISQAGPVPTELKVDLYERLLATRDWAVDAVSEDLLHGTVEYFGKLDRTAAARIERAISRREASEES